MGTHDVYTLLDGDSWSLNNGPLRSPNVICPLMLLALVVSCNSERGDVKNCGNARTHNCRWRKWGKPMFS